MFVEQPADFAAAVGMRVHIGYNGSSIIGFSKPERKTEACHTRSFDFGLWALDFGPAALISAGMLFLRAVQLWILLSTLASVAGWTLSALGMLDKTGYTIFAAVTMVLAFAFRKSALFCSFPSVQTVWKLKHRMRRFLPAAFAILATLVFISGCLYAPSNHTGLSYRTARVLQWLQHGSWFWIHTPNYRMNDRACGIEWLSAPILLFLKSDRALFLLNFIPFILMPGLIFSVWTRLGMRPRVAWHWMWLLPTGYCFLIQAGGIANDGFPTIYALAMMDFALRARDKCRVLSVEQGSAARVKDFRPWTLDLGLSLLSAALLVGAKASNLPLGLPWAIAIFPLIPRLFSTCIQDDATRNAQHATRRYIKFSVVVLIAILVSFVPTALLNIRYLHDWSGLSIEHAGMNMKNPIAGILGNAVLLITNNFVPTFFPMAHWWNVHALSLLPGALVRLMNANFEQGYEALGEMPTEDSAALGFGVSMLVLVSVIAGVFSKRKTQYAPRLGVHAFRFLLVAPWIALLAYCVKTGMVTPGRLIAPYYPLLLPLLLMGAGQSQIVRHRWWMALAGVVLLLALAALVVAPSRPLWPANTILAKAVAIHPGQPQLQRAQKVYEVYRQRSDPLAAIREHFPKNLKIIGFMGTDDDLDISLWKPYGSRRVEPFFVTDSPEYIHQLGIEYAVVSGLDLASKNVTIDEWRQKTGAELIFTTSATLTVSQGPEPWYLVRFKP